MTGKERYSNLDGLRALSCLCIIIYHVRKYSDFVMPGTLGRIIDLWTQFVPLFLMLSGFGMFCGYYGAFKNNTVDLSDFYLRRYKRILPFFAFVILAELVVDPTPGNAVQAFAEGTLVFGLLSNATMNVCGVGWTLGIIFLFYMLFPFFVFTCYTKKRALFSFAVSIALSVCCYEYFFTDKFGQGIHFTRNSFLYLAAYFIGGGLIYLFRDGIRSFIGRYRIPALVFCAAATVAYYFVPMQIKGFSLVLFKNLALFMLWIAYAISVRSTVLSNKVTSYLSGISLEMYLCQMIFYRLIEKTVGLYRLGHGLLSFITVCILTVVCDIAFVALWKRGVSYLNSGKVREWLRSGLR